MLKEKEQEPDDDLFDAEPMELHEILKFLAKGQLQLYQQLREVVAGSSATYEPEASNLTTAAIAAGHGLGSPHIHLLLAAMEADPPAKLEAGLKKQMNEVAKALEDKGKQYIGEHIFHFRVKEMYNKSDSGQV